jgi:hypothetical protein
MDETPICEIDYSICQMLKFYGGGVGYTELCNMPLNEIKEIYRNMIKISREEEKAIEKASRKK